MQAFTVGRIPKLIFGEQSMYALPEELKKLGYRSAVVVTGGSSLERNGIWDAFSSALQKTDISYSRFSVAHEPSPADVDSAAELRRSSRTDCIVGIGGGSVIDTAKAASAMVHAEGSVKEYLEGVGTKTHSGTRIPLIAVPTTSGTGSEATKNAVISEVGPNGFKKSLRHDNFVPDIAVLDPSVIQHCPASVTAASGLDAITQLLESFVSVKANQFTDSLAGDALRLCGKYFETVVVDGNNLEARGAMAYGAYISGITLANVGLGIVHGAAGVLGSRISVPHGTACGTLLAEASRMIIEKAEAEGLHDVLSKYADAGYAIAGTVRENDTEKGIDMLLSVLYRWQELLDAQSSAKLSAYGLKKDDIADIAAKSGLKNTPVQLSTEEIASVLEKRL